MMPGESVPELMRRTMFNLHFIQEKRGPTGPYEVTQLINSFLGALAHPWERYGERLKHISLRDAEAEGWPRLEKVYKTDKEPKNLGDLIRLIRNGVAHGNIIFHPDPGGEIRSLHIWNVDPRENKRTWGSVLTIEQMRTFLDKFVETAEVLHLPKTGRMEGSMDRGE